MLPGMKNLFAPPRLRIATISLDLPDDAFKPKESTSFTTHYLLHNLKPTARRTAERILLRSVRNVCKKSNKPRYILINELGYPRSCWQDGKKETEGQLERSLIQYANKYDVVIIAGSYHCTDTLFNRTVIFHPGMEDNPIYHLKKTSAGRDDEYIKIPFDRDVHIYQTAYCSFGILVCLDSYDPSLAISLLRACKADWYRTHPLDIIFVPSYNKDQKWAKLACKDLSQLLSCIVVLANVREYAGGLTRQVFQCGEKVIGRRVAGRDPVCLYSIDMKEFRSQKSESERDRRTYFREILGLP